MFFVFIPSSIFYVCMCVRGEWDYLNQKMTLQYRVHYEKFTYNVFIFSKHLFVYISSKNSDGFSQNLNIWKMWNPKLQSNVVHSKIAWRDADMRVGLRTKWYEYLNSMIQKIKPNIECLSTDFYLNSKVQKVIGV